MILPSAWALLPAPFLILLSALIVFEVYEGKMHEHHAETYRLFVRLSLASALLFFALFGVSLFA